MASTLAQIRKTRIEKLEKLRKAGIDPYPSSTERTHKNQDVVDLFDQLKEEKVTVVGRIMSMRGHGAVMFIDLRDQSGKVQLYLKEENLKKVPKGSLSLKNIDLVDIGDFVEATGRVTKTERGEVSVEVSLLRMLSKSIRPLPEKWEGLKDAETKYRQRYVDLVMSPEKRRIFDIRAALIESIRQFFIDEGFIELETPVLQPVYGGAAAKPFITHHNALDNDFYLRISNEMYLKKVIVSGYEKVFEYSRNFRNEGLSRQHNPEFTMLEFYAAYKDYEYLMDISEKMLSKVIKEVMGTLKIKYEDTELDFTPPYKKVNFWDLVKEKTGIDLDKANTEEKLRQAAANLKIEGLDKAVGYGALVDEIYKATCRPEIIQPTFLLDYPVELIPLAKKKFDEPRKIETVQLLAYGFEVFKAYSELNDPVDQAERMLESKKTEEKGAEEYYEFDHDYVRALEYGMPPTAGWGMGIDRLVALLTNQHGLKDVILFPTLRPEEIPEEEKKWYKKDKVACK